MHRWVVPVWCFLASLVLLAAPLAVVAADADTEHADTEHAATGAEHASAADDSHADAGQADGAHASNSGGHGDPYDLSHQNGTDKLEDPSEFKSDLAIWTFIVFVCLLLVLLKFAWRPIIEGLEKRERSIADMIDEAKASADKAAEQLRQYEAKLEAAGEAAREVLAQAQRDAESVKDRIVAEAQTAAQRERERAVADIETAKNVALQEITTRGVDLAVTMAGRIVRRQLNPEDQAKLIREALDQLPSRN